MAGTSEGQRSSGMMAGLGGVSQQKHTRYDTCSFTTAFKLHHCYCSSVAWCLLLCFAARVGALSNPGRFLVGFIPLDDGHTSDIYFLQH